MKRALLGCALAASAIASTVAASPRRAPSGTGSGGPLLWKGVRHGMTETQLRTILPGVTEGDKPSRLAAPSTEVAGQALSVAIGMDSGKVSYVALYSEHAIAKPISDALTAKYGKPVQPYRCEMQSAMQSCSGKWKVGARVQATLSDMTMQSASLTTVTYELPDTGGI
jgi:hypothetical protein